MDISAAVFHAFFAQVAEDQHANVDNQFFAPLKYFGPIFQRVRPEWLELFYQIKGTGGINQGINLGGNHDYKSWV